MALHSLLEREKTAGGGRVVVMIFYQVASHQWMRQSVHVNKDLRVTQIPLISTIGRTSNG
jgi:hypothetical protein